MADKKVTPPLGAYPQPPQPQAPFLPAPPQHVQQQYGVVPVSMAGGSGYGVSFGGGGGPMYAPPPYDQLQHHQPLPALPQHLPQMYSGAAAMYAAAAAGYPGYIGYPVQYYPYYPTVQPSIQQLRPTIMIPNGFEAGVGGRLEGLAGSLLPPPPAVPPSPAHLAALQPHQVLWR